MNRWTDRQTDMNGWQQQDKWVWMSGWAVNWMDEWMTAWMDK